MRLVERLNQNVALVDEALEALTARQDMEISALLEAERYSLLSPRAKRIRPTLVLEFSRLFGGEDTVAIVLAAAIEMVHTYSLIHDDLPCMDNDDLRRGRPTCHKVFGETTALLAGDGLLTLAFEVISAATALSDKAVRDAVLVLSSAAGNFGMIGGQIIDMKGETERLDEQMLLKLHAGKTGALIAAAAELGCVAAGLARDDIRTKAAVAYAKGIGLAFQIVDDVLDVTSSEEITGKSVCSDGVKTTFMTYYTPDAALAYARRITDQAKMAISDLHGADFLIELADYLIERKC